MARKRTKPERETTKWLNSHGIESDRVDAPVPPGVNENKAFIVTIPGDSLIKDGLHRGDQVFCEITDKLVPGELHVYRTPRGGVHFKHLEHKPRGARIIGRPLRPLRIVEDPEWPTFLKEIEGPKPKIHVDDYDW